MYPELDGIDYVFYVENGKLSATILDRNLLDGKGNPWYLGAYGNCVIGLKSGRIKKLCLLSKENMESMRLDSRHLLRNEVEKQFCALEEYASKVIIVDHYGGLY